MTYSRIMKAQHAINLLAYQLSASRQAMNSIPDLQHGKAELDGVLTHIADNLEGILDKTAGPVWGELTEETRAVCRQAGMTNEEMSPAREISRLRKELMDLKRYAEGHHRDEESCHWLHALTIDIPHRIDVVLGIGGH